jgi:pimeloyl-ACP methyl ester carboxylesterase
MSEKPRRRLWRIALAALAVIVLAWVVLRAWPAPVAPPRTRPEKARRTPFPEQDLVVQGLRLRLIDVGPRDGAATPLLLIPGHTSRIEEYDSIVPRLSRDRRVICFDYPGSGYSEKPDRRYTLGFYEDVTIGVLDALGIRKCDVGGGSQGGHLTLRLAARFPDRFERLCPWSPGGAWTARPTLARAIDLVSSYGFFVPVVRVQSTYWHRKDWPGREAALADTWRYYDEVMGPGFVDMYWGMAQDQVAHSLFDVVAGVSHPTLLLAGDLDSTPGMLEGVHRIASLMPHCELRVYAGNGHAIAGEASERVAEDVAAFLASPAAAATPR